jgi:hypothetical protein
MKYMVLVAVALCGLASACAVRSERTVVERPAVAPASAAVVVADPAPTTTTVYVPN